MAQAALSENVPPTPIGVGSERTPTIVRRNRPKARSFQGTERQTSRPLHLTGLEAKPADMQAYINLDSPTPSRRASSGSPAKLALPSKQHRFPSNATANSMPEVVRFQAELLDTEAFIRIASNHRCSNPMLQYQDRDAREHQKRHALYMWLKSMETVTETTTWTSRLCDLGFVEKVKLQSTTNTASPAVISHHAFSKPQGISWFDATPHEFERTSSTLALSLAQTLPFPLQHSSSLRRMWNNSCRLTWDPGI
jgi:hypothetical protein